jgi:hypothetical protein
VTSIHIYIFLNSPQKDQLDQFGSRGRSCNAYVGSKCRGPGAERNGGAVCWCCGSSVQRCRRGAAAHSQSALSAQSCSCLLALLSQRVLQLHRPQEKGPEVFNGSHTKWRPKNGRRSPRKTRTGRGTVGATADTRQFQQTTRIPLCSFQSSSLYQIRENRMIRWNRASSFWSG